MNTAQLTGYYNPYAGTQISPEVSQYAGDYQAEINRRRATPDTSDDALIPQLEAARANKILSSPDLTAKYGDQYKTVAQQQRDLESQLAMMEAEAARDPNNPDNIMKRLELQKLQQEVEMLGYYGPQEQALKLQEIKSRIAENAASAGASNALAKQRLSETGKNASGYTLKDYIDIGLDMKNKGNNNAIRNEYGDIIGNEYKPVYDDDYIYDWIVDLAAQDMITEREAEELAATLKVTKTPNKNAPQIKRSTLFD